MRNLTLGPVPLLAQRDSPQGWAVVFAAMIGVAVGLSPLPFYTIGMFAPELSREFGWTFASLMGSIAVQSAVVMVASPIAGIVIDRYGARPVAMISLLLFGLAFMSMSLNTGSLWMFYAQWAVMAVVGTGTLSATWTRVVNGWFDRHRGLALGIASTGTGLTGFLIKPLTAWLILHYGWRGAFVVIGLIPIVIGMPIVWRLFRERTDVAPVDGVRAAPIVEDGLTLKQALRSHRFWIMALSFLLMAFALTAPTPNLENILRLAQFDLLEIGRITAAFGLAVIVGRIVGGWLLDRIWAPACAVGVLLIPALGSWLLASDALSGEMALFAVIALGIGAGFEFDLLAYLIGRYFGQRNYGSIYGCFYAVIALGGGLGPVVYGYAFDRLNSYGLVLTSGAILLAISGAVLLLLGTYPRFSPPQSGVSAAGEEGT